MMPKSSVMGVVRTAITNLQEIRWRRRERGELGVIRRSKKVEERLIYMSLFEHDIVPAMVGSGKHETPEPARA